MKFISFIFFSLFIFSASFSQKKSPEILNSNRIEKVINSQWTFNYFPGISPTSGYETPAFDDSKWPVISIPHTWSTYETTGELHPFIRNTSETDNPYWWTGWGWYRKHFSVNAGYSDHKVFIEFDGVQKYCKVWLNGKYLGDHKGGYGTFDFDIGAILKPGVDNVLAVAVNNRPDDEFMIPPMSAGNFDVYSGIYRDVRLLLTDKLYIPVQGSASHEGGTFVTTPGVTEKEGIVRVQTWIRNDNPEKVTCSLVTSIADSSGNVVQVMKSDADINPGQLYMFDQTSKPVKNPHLWSPETPYMYKVHSQVMNGKTLTDEYLSPLGFRWFRWDYKENCLHLNGHKMMIHGGNRHQDYPWLGDAVPKWITALDFKDIAMNLNYNFIRTAHYPNDRSVYDLTDKYGIVTEEELPNIKNLQFSSVVQEQQLKEMIRRDRNHPGIMFWSMGNETNHAADSKYAVAEDTTRILTVNKVTDGSAGAFVKHNEKNLNVESLLGCTVRGWHQADPSTPESSDPQQAGTEERQVNMLMESEKTNTGNLCTWIYEDHGADRQYINSPVVNVNPKGLVDGYRFPKYAYFLWQASYSKNLMVFVQPYFWSAKFLGQNRDIIINSNCDKVELFINGASKGFQYPEESNFHTVTFKNIVVEKGTLSAVGTKDDKTVRKDVMMAGVPAKIVLSASDKKIAADKSSVVIITADITDSGGNHICGAKNTVKWSLSGPASLLGPPVYESDINKCDQKDGTWYMEMPVSNIIRSAGIPGKIQISVSASGLASGTIEIEAVETPADNSGVIEPPLRDIGRMKVSRIVMNTGTLEEAPREIKPVNNDFNEGVKDKHGYLIDVKEFIFVNNQAVDTTTVEFHTLSDLLANQLLNSGGHLAAIDYNYNTGHYNKCRLISGYINATKLPQPFKDGLKRYYSDVIIRNGDEKDAGEEMNWLNWIPSGGTVVVVQNTNNLSNEKGVIVTGNAGLNEIISTVYPQFNGFSKEAKERALIFTAKMNPFVHISPVSGQKPDAGKETIPVKSYSAEKGQPVLVPLLKFISE